MKACEKYKLPSDLGTARVNQFSPLTYDSESEGKLTLEKLAASDEHGYTRGQREATCTHTRQNLYPCQGYG